MFREPRFRFFAYAFLLMVRDDRAARKHYYPADIYPILIAAGGVQVEAWMVRASFAGVRAVTATAAFFCAIGIPLQVPVLSVEQLVAYKESALRRLDPVSPELATDRERAPDIGSDFADMHGWPESADAARNAYLALPPAERARAVVFATDYGQASALRFFAPGVPVVSGHNQYWLWGYGDASGDVILELGGTCWKSQTPSPSAPLRHATPRRSRSWRTRTA